MDTTVITEMAEYYEKEIGYKLPSRTPFVGKNFNVLFTFQSVGLPLLLILVIQGSICLLYTSRCV